MAQLEKEMENLGEESGEASPVSSSSGPKASSGARLPPGAMPTTQSGALDRLANEFWFPECRNCPCCKGYVIVRGLIWVMFGDYFFILLLSYSISSGALASPDLLLS